MSTEDKNVWMNLDEKAKLEQLAVKNNHLLRIVSVIKVKSVPYRIEHVYSCPNCFMDIHTSPKGLGELTVCHYCFAFLLQEGDKDE